MNKKLIIAEKPSLAKNIADALNIKNRKDGYIEGDKYIISWAFGHLFSLKDVDSYLGEKTKWSDVKLPFFPKEFEFILKDDSGIKKQFKILKELSNRSDVTEIINCGDADREGQVIIDLVIKNTGFNKKVSRLWLPEQTEETIIKSINDMKDNSSYENLLNEGLARTYMDWMLGINLTRYLTLKSDQLFPCGRVLIPIIKFIYDRDLSIMNFKKEQYYQIESKSKVDDAYVHLVIKDEKYSIEEKEKAIMKTNLLNKYKAVVNKVESKEVIKQPSKLFSLSKLQSKLSKDFKISFADSLKDIQSLYEKGYITYPRTNTEYLAENEKDKVKEIIQRLTEHNLEFKDVKRIFDNSKIESHSAITPTTKIPSNLNENEEMIYNVVLNRFISNFLIEPSVICQVDIEISVNGEIFTLKGESIKQEGFLRYEPQKFENKLPNLKKGQEFDVNFEIIKKETSPPKKVNEGDLANYLKNPFRKEILEENVEDQNDEEEYKAILKGTEIGTEATRTGIIENAKRYKYISQNKQSYSIEPLGISFIEILGKLNIDLYKDKTVEFSILQKEVYKGKKSIEEVIEKVKDELNQIIKQDIEIEKIAHKEEKEVIGKCPRCKGNIYESKVSFYCENFKNKDDPCKFSLFKKDKFFQTRGKTITKTIAKKLLQNGQVEMKKLKSKNGNEYNAIFIMQDTGRYVNFKAEFI